MSFTQWIHKKGTQGVQALQRAYWATQHPTNQLRAAYKYLNQEDKDAAELLIDISYYYPLCLSGVFPDLEQYNLDTSVSMLLEKWDHLAYTQCSTKEEAIELVRKIDESNIDRSFARRFFAHSKYPGVPSNFVTKFPILWFQFELCRKGTWLDIEEQHATLTNDEQTTFPLRDYLE